MKSKILFGLSFLMGLLFINGGLNKLFHYMPVPDDLPEAMVKDFGAMMEIVWLMPLLAASEIVGGLLIIVPRTRAVGALVLLPIVVGILLTHLFVEPGSLPVALVLSGITGWILADNWPKYLGLLKK